MVGTAAYDGVSFEAVMSYRRFSVIFGGGTRVAASVRVMIT